MLTISMYLSFLFICNILYKYVLYLKSSLLHDFLGNKNVVCCKISLFYHLISHNSHIFQVALFEKSILGIFMCNFPKYYACRTM